MTNIIVCIFIENFNTDKYRTRHIEYQLLVRDQDSETKNIYVVIYYKFVAINGG